MLAQRSRTTKPPSIAALKYSLAGTALIHRRFIILARGCAPFSPFIGVLMMTLSSRAVAAAFASLLLASTAFAQTATAPAAAPATTAAPKKAEKPKSPESIECSKQADEKGLHGKERKKFRSDCLKEAKAAAGAAKSK
jgi:hypothetical protein